jgi:hypothetical protein
MTPNPKDQGWYGIAEEASKEMDGARLTTLVAQLCSALDDRNNGGICLSLNRGLVCPQEY